tara:strand:+ start:603 stop:905 length:303 start_codon:yes stop_codon:yes gene_type:complete
MTKRINIKKAAKDIFAQINAVDRSEGFIQFTNEPDLGRLELARKIAIGLTPDSETIMKIYEMVFNLYSGSDHDFADVAQRVAEMKEDAALQIALHRERGT